MHYQFVDGTRLSSVVEALIFSSPDPLSPEKIATLLQQNEEDLSLAAEDVQAIVDELNQRYEANDLAFRIERLGGGFTFATQPRYYPWMTLFQHEHLSRRLSQTALETLAIIAYKQPLTKPEVDQIRGVDSGYAVRHLLERDLIKVSGRADSPGKPLLYKTTDLFLRHFGINRIDELPKPREIEDILKDDDMAEHRQFLLDNTGDLFEQQSADAEEASGGNIMQAEPGIELTDPEHDAAEGEGTSEGSKNE